jgi:SAM-dependent methyltransferase
MSLYQRCFAWGLAAGGDAYERLVAIRKRELLGPLRGTVLEIGPGTGTNLAYLAPDVRWLGIEPNPHMERYLRREAEPLGRSIEVRSGTVERLDLMDASVDAVVSTLVLCSVPDQARALAEVRRVLRPGGRLPPVSWASSHAAGTPSTTTAVTRTQRDRRSDRYRRAATSHSRFRNGARQPT